MPYALLLLLVSALLLGAYIPPAAAQAATEERLRAAIQKITGQYPEATVAVAVRDPATDTQLSIHGDRPFHAASTMKVPVMIEVFRQARQGYFTLDDSLEVRNTFRSIVDGSTFSIEDDSDDAIYERLGQRMAICDLVHNMITVSSNLATNLLIDFVDPDSVQHTIERMGTRHMKVLRGVEDIKAYRQGLSNTATASDLALLMDALWRGEAVSPSASETMVTILLDQEFDEMIPAGLPDGARAAHKTGWITMIHHDAAIVYPVQGAPYVLVILTEGIAEHNASAQLGAEITAAVHEILRGRTD